MATEDLDKAPETPVRGLQRLPWMLLVPVVAVVVLAATWGTKPGAAILVISAWCSRAR
jgi:hypothetical protein